MQINLLINNIHLRGLKTTLSRTIAVVIMIMDITTIGGGIKVIRIVLIVTVAVLVILESHGAAADTSRYESKHRQNNYENESY